MGRRIPALMLVLLLLGSQASAEEITLVKRARRVQPGGDEAYTVQSGDTLWKIFLRVYDAKPEDMPYLYQRFREVNPRVKDLDHIFVGQKIVIPRLPQPGEAFSSEQSSHDLYIMKKGQHLAMVLRHVYGLSDREIFNEYLTQVQKLNPEINDLDRVEAGQRIRLPRKGATVNTPAPAPAPEPVAAKPEPVTAPEPVVEPDVVPEPVVELDVVPEPVVELEPIIEPEPVVEPEPMVEPEPVVARDPVPPARPEPPLPAEPEEKPAPPAPEPEEKTATVASAATTGGVAGSAGSANGSGDVAARHAAASRLVRQSLLPAFGDMGGTSRDKGTYFMPLGNGSISIDAAEMPVLELDTGRRIILDLEGHITPEVEGLINQTFPDCRVVRGDDADLTALVDRILDVSGYFSVNRNPAPLLVGGDEKVRFSGKWVVYKDYERSNVYVINVLGADEERTPAPITDYASRFGIDLIEIGGVDALVDVPQRDYIVDLQHSPAMLLAYLGVASSRDAEIELLAGKVISIAYTAPLLVDKLILTEEMPDATMQKLLAGKGYELLDVSKMPLAKLLERLDISFDGPPVRMGVAGERSQVELPGLKTENTLILSRPIDHDIAGYLAARGLEILLW